MGDSSSPSYSSGSGGGKNSSAFSPAVVAIIAVLGSAFLVVSYYRIFSKLCSRWQNQREELEMEEQMHAAEMDGNASPMPARGLDEALIKKISVFTYKSGDGFTVETDCPVCLMDFSNGQELRMLPKCAHAFHVACIDTWLGTHSTCPLCRAGIWPVEVMNQYPYSPGASIYGTDSVRLPAMESDRMDYAMGDGPRFNSGGHGRYPVPTLRGLLNYEDQHHHTIWIPGSSGRGDPGEDSIRLYDSRDHGGDSSSRRHSLTIPGAAASSITPTPPPSISENEDSRSSTYFSTDTGPQAPLSRTASFKEPHSRSRDRDHKWRIPARRPSFRRNPFSVVRSYSMGTSRRLVHALEFLDLEDMRNSQRKSVDKLFSPHEYGITEAPDYPANLTTSTAEVIANGGTTEKISVVGAGSHEQVAGPSSETKARLSSARLSSVALQDRASDLDLRDSSLKSSGPGRGRSVSFRSPFSLKSTGSGGRTLFSFRQPGRARVSSSSFSPSLAGP